MPTLQLLATCSREKNGVDLIVKVHPGGLRRFIIMPTVSFRLLLLLFVPLAVTAQISKAPRERISLNAAWRFQKGDPAGTEGQLAYEKIKSLFNATGNEFAARTDPMRPLRPEGRIVDNVPYLRRDFDDRTWRQLNLPHDWGIEGPFETALSGETGKLPWAGIGWYRKHLAFPRSDRGRQIYLDIDGAMAYASVWLNGRFVGGWPYGYASFRVDLSPYIEFDQDNVIAIRLDNPPDSSRWYPGGGIYRNVWLVKSGPVHISQWGTYVTTPEVTPTSAEIALKVTLDNHTRSEASLTISSQVYEVTSGGQVSFLSEAGRSTKEHEITRIEFCSCPLVSFRGSFLYSRIRQTP